MDLDLGAEYETFQKRAEDFARGWNAADAGVRDAEIAWRIEAAEAGLLYLDVPREYGGAGTGGDPLKDAIVRLAFHRAGAPHIPTGVGTRMMVPTILKRGTEAQKQRFVPPALSGAEIWCQGYSEPNAGSDLASLRTRAELSDGQWVINGSKIWTSGAEKSDFMFILTRTEPDAPRHRGISYLLLDMRQDGITIRPLRQMTGEAGFNEVFFDDARTPEDWIVGGRGDGWSVARTTLGFERTAINAPSVMFDVLRMITERLGTMTRMGKPLLEDEAVIDAIGVAEGYAMAHLANVLRQVSMDRAGQVPGIAATCNKLHATNVGLRLGELAQMAQGDAGLTAPPEGMTRDTMDDRFWVMRALGVTIAGGTSNIQRNIIAERGLGLPREERG
ncbi:acyl-CoA dehydrogenase [Rhodobacterales bacterium HKCCE2091]|nr:acyl-CoA dehydrogenase [Rhodobacterales bacterium HKCCE2091]